LGKFTPTEGDLKKQLLLKGPVIVDINTEDIEAFYYSSKAEIGDKNETLESIKPTAKEETTVSFSNYKKGIMEQDLIKESAIAIAQQQSTENIVIPEEGSILVQIDATQVINQDHGHSVLIVGWGHDKETNLNYWIARNSFGDAWGMSGDMYIRRGMNDFAIESEG